jgi:hypothetical protein
MTINTTSLISLEALKPDIYEPAIILYGAGNVC